MRDTDYLAKTNCQVLGATQYGKSKLIQYCCRPRVAGSGGFTILDWKGSLYDQMLRYCAENFENNPWLSRRVVLLDPAGGYITPFNLFKSATDPATKANRLAQTLLKSSGETVNDMPTYERMITMVLTACFELHMPIITAIAFLHWAQLPLRQWVLQNLKDIHAKNTLRDLLSITNITEWNRVTQSSMNRLYRLTYSNGLLATLDMPGDFKIAPGGAYSKVDQSESDIERLWASDSILLVKLRPDLKFAEEGSRMLASLILDQFLSTALRHPEFFNYHHLYLDEAQEYITSDVASLLDLSIQSGLRTTLIHHHNEQPRIKPFRASLETNARLKYIFGGLPVSEKKYYAEEFFLEEINKSMPRQTRHRTETEYERTTFAGWNDGTASHEYGDSTISGTGVHEGLHPHQRVVEDGTDDWSRDEKIAKFAAKFDLPPQQCIAYNPQRVELFKVPDVPYVNLPKSDKALECMEHIRDNQLTYDEAWEAIFKIQTAFLERTGNDSGRNNAKKKPADLHPQG